MILLAAIASGALASLLRARIRGRRLTSPNLRQVEIVLFAFGLQFLAFQFPTTRSRIPDWTAASLLILSLGMLMVFILKNRNKPGFLALGIGLFLNLLVITLNGGFMPISPEAVRMIAPEARPGTWEIEQRLGFGKDIVLMASSTRLQFLSDCLLLPGWFPYQVAFSIGDLFIALGAFCSLWALSGPQFRTSNIDKSHHGENTMTQAENQIIEIFCRELALALRRITGRQITISPDALPIPMKPNGDGNTENDNEEKHQENGGEK